jgi:hypothetical protein
MKKAIAIYATNIIIMLLLLRRVTRYHGDKFIVILLFYVLFMTLLNLTGAAIFGFLKKDIYKTFLRSCFLIVVVAFLFGALLGR